MLTKKVICSLWWFFLLGQADLALADLAQTARFNIEPMTLQEALSKYSAQSGVRVNDPSGLISTKSSIGVMGQYPAQTALTRILTGTTLSFDVIDQNTVALRVVPAPVAPTPPVATTASGTDNKISPPTTPGTDMTEIPVIAPEPRFAAPTRRDHTGRIWAPVYINDRGPYRLVLDSGAGGSGVTMPVVRELGLPLDQTPPVMLRGVTGTLRVPTTRVDSIAVGDIVMEPDKLLVIPDDALDGAEGILDTEGFKKDRRIFIDFRNDAIRITRSHKERAPSGFVTVPFRLIEGQILVDARIGKIRGEAIINTGGQSTIANGAMRDALFNLSKHVSSKSEQITGITADVQTGDSVVVPSIGLGPIEIRQCSVVFGDMSIFKSLDFTSQPTLLIGMDTIGSFDTFIIDYRRRELQIRMPGPGTSRAMADTQARHSPG